MQTEIVNQIDITKKMLVTLSFLFCYISIYFSFRLLHISSVTHQSQNFTVVGSIRKDFA